MDTNEYLDAFLDKKGITQKEFCEMTDIPYSTIKGMKNRGGNPSHKTLKKIKSVFSDFDLSDNQVNVVSEVSAKYNKGIISSVSEITDSYNTTINYDEDDFSIDEIVHILKMKDQQLRAKDEQLKAKDVQIKEKDKQIDAKDKQLSDLSLENARLSGIIESMDDRIENMRTELNRVNEERINDIKDFVEGKFNKK